jgi:hypothetical protein
MTRILALVLCGTFLLAGCGIDGEPLTPSAKTAKTAG